jgi:hypothetical protein
MIDEATFTFSRSIKRVIFYSLIKPVVNEKGEKEMDVISVSAALQIAGRAGRFGTCFEHVTSCKINIRLES